MSGNHSYGAARIGTTTGKHAKRLGWALTLTSIYLVAEVIGGLATGSLALLADAAHMLTDVAGLGLALFAIWFASKPATPQKTYGFVRAEILATLANAVLLLLITLYVLFEAYQRLLAPPSVQSLPMLAVAVVGLIVNLVSMRILAAGSKESLNLKAAYFEVWADLLGSLGVIVAAVIIYFTGWSIADPIIGGAIGLFIIPRTWRLLSQAVHVLLEGVPPDVAFEEVEQALKEIDGVGDVHDLHVWTITSGLDAMSCHLIIHDFATSHVVLEAAQTVLRERFKIDHATIQIEGPDTKEERSRL